MLNTRDLERRWLKYKIKSFIPHVVISVSIIVISTSIALYLVSDHTEKSIAIENNKIETSNQNTVPATQLSKKTEIKDTPTIASVIETEIAPVTEPTPLLTKKVVLKPSLDFIKKIQESSDGYYKKTPKVQTFNTPYADAKPVHTVQKNTTQQTVEAEDVVVEETPVKTEKAKKIVIARETSIQDIKDAEKRFKKSNSPALSLFLAKQYYARGDYSKSYNYALITNQLDKNNEDSWLIFSRSLVKLGKVKLAKKALNEYIRFSHSSNAELLLDDITTGEFQ